MNLKHTLMLAASAILSAAAFIGCSCGDSSCGKDEAAAAAKTKPLVVYWTWSETHNTTVVAEMLKEKTKGNLSYDDMFTNVKEAVSFESSLHGLQQIPTMITGGKTKDTWTTMSFK